MCKGLSSLLLSLQQLKAQLLHLKLWGVHHGLLIPLGKLSQQIQAVGSHSHKTMLSSLDGYEDDESESVRTLLQPLNLLFSSHSTFPNDYNRSIQLKLIFLLYHTLPRNSLILAYLQDVERLS